jgi:hypothetical protein
VGVDLDSLVRDTIETAFPHEQEVQAEHDRYLMRVRPYKTWDNKIEGAKGTFMNMDAIRLTMEEPPKGNHARNTWSVASFALSVGLRTECVTRFMQD